MTQMRPSLSLTMRKTSQLEPMIHIQTWKARSATTSQMNLAPWLLSIIGLDTVTRMICYLSSGIQNPVTYSHPLLSKYGLHFFGKLRKRAHGAKRIVMLEENEIAFDVARHVLKTYLAQPIHSSMITYA
jgi:hypothetical protein